MGVIIKLDIMEQFTHPDADAITLPGLLAALADPIRLRIVKTLIEQDGCLPCCKSVKCTKLAKSTLSRHFKVLREAGLIRTTKQGVANQNKVRVNDIEARFPGFLDAVLRHVPLPDNG